MKFWARSGRAVEGGSGEGGETHIHPVGGRAEGDAVGSIGQRPDLGHDDPRAGAPGVAEVDDEEPAWLAFRLKSHVGKQGVIEDSPNHSHGGPASSSVVLPGIAVLGDDDCDDDMAGGHADGADGEHRLSSDLVNVENRRNGGSEHDNANDAGGEKGDGV